MGWAGEPRWGAALISDAVRPDLIIVWFATTRSASD
jgi:hypothetical protein